MVDVASLGESGSQNARHRQAFERQQCVGEERGLAFDIEAPGAMDQNLQGTSNCLPIHALFGNEGGKQGRMASTIDRVSNVLGLLKLASVRVTITSSRALERVLDSKRN